MNQTKVESFIEATANQGSGFIISMLVWGFVIAPLLASGILTLADNFIIMLVFFTISFIRSYLWRRFFNAGLHKAVHNFMVRRWNSKV